MKHENLPDYARPTLYPGKDIVESAYRGVAVVAYRAWLGTAALAVGLGAAALASSGVANADTAGRPVPHHTIAASHSPVKTVAHTAPRPKPSAALIAASTVTGVANHKPTPATAVTNRVATSSAPPNPGAAHATAGAVPNNLVDLQQVVHTVIGYIQKLSGAVFFIAAMPVYIPLFVAVLIYDFTTPGLLF